MGENFEVNKTEKNLSAFIYEWLDVVCVAIVCVVLIFGFVFRVATIDGTSMNNTLIDGEKVFVNNAFYSPKQGDIVIISRNYKNDTDIDLTDTSTTPIIKRVIATEGQIVDIKDGSVYVDGKKIKEDYVLGETFVGTSVSFPLTVQKKCVFVLGDNRKVSLDSRSANIGNYGNGQIHQNYILGKATFRIYPLNKVGGLG